jgi:hypothetical protein
MPLPHFTNIEVGTKLQELVYKNLFEVQIILPDVLQTIYSVDTSNVLLLQNTVSFTVPVYPTIGTLQQRFKYSTRLYTTVPETTSKTDVKLDFNMNVNDKKQVETWNVIKTWYDLVWNNENGTVNYKTNLVGTIIGYIHDKEGEILRRITYHNCQPLSIAGWDSEINWESIEMAKLSGTWASDYWEDFYY